MSNENFFKLNIHYGGICFRKKFQNTHIRKLNVIFYSIRRKCTKCHNNNIGLRHKAVHVKYQLIKYKTNKLSHLVSPQKCSVSKLLRYYLVE